MRYNESKYIILNCILQVWEQGEIRLMLISVVYQNNKMGLVADSKLNDLISSNKIKQFLRADGWVTIGVNPLRKINGYDYKGREKRQLFKI